MADILPTTTDSHTRNEQFVAAQKGVDESERLAVQSVYESSQPVDLLMPQAPRE